MRWARALDRHQERLVGVQPGVPQGRDLFAQMFFQLGGRRPTARRRPDLYPIERPFLVPVSATGCGLISAMSLRVDPRLTDIEFRLGLLSMPIPQAFQFLVVPFGVHYSRPERGIVEWRICVQPTVSML